MSPLDDELRAALRSRADVLTPSPDPLAGIEARARGMRRRRNLASVAGAGLAVAVIAFAVPAILPSPNATPQPYTSVSPAPTAQSYALDPANPWAFRGTPLPTGALEGLQAKWAAAHPGSTLAPLFSRVYEPTRQQEVAFVATGGGAPRYGYAWLGGDVGQDTFAVDLPLPGSANVLAYLLPGDEVQRVIAIAAPGVSSFTLGSTAMTSLADGIAGAPFGQPEATLMVKAPNGTILFDGPVPTGEKPAVAAPTNLLDWPTRGAMESDLLDPARKALAPSLQATAAQVELKLLFVGDTDSGVAFLMGQAWKKGSDTAYSFSYAEGGTTGPALFFGPATPANPPALAFLLTDLPGTSTEQLVVIPTPRTGLVSYDDNATGAFRAITAQDYLEGVVIIDRRIGETDDRLEILDGNGDLDNPTYRGPVAPFLCGIKSCS